MVLYILAASSAFIIIDALPVTIQSASLEVVQKDLAIFMFISRTLV